MPIESIRSPDLLKEKLKKGLTVGEHQDAAGAMRVCLCMMNCFFCLIFDHQGLKDLKAMEKIGRAALLLVKARDVLENDLFNAAPYEQRVTAEIKDCYGGPVASADLDRVRQMWRISNKTESAIKDE